MDLVPASGFVIYRNSVALPPAAILETESADREILGAGDPSTIAMWRSVPGNRAGARPRRVGRPGAVGTVFLSTEYDAGWELQGTLGDPEVAFGWATSFPAEGEPVRIRHGGSLPATDPGRAADDPVARRAVGDEEAGGSMRALA